MSVSGPTFPPPPKSSAVRSRDQSAASTPRLARHSGFGRFCHRYALLFAWAVTIAIFSVVEPDSFLQVENFASMFNSQAVLVVLTLSLVITLTASEYDLSVASVLSLSAMLVAILNAQLHVAIGWAILAAFAAGIAVGTINGVLVVIVGINRSSLRSAWAR